MFHEVKGKLKEIAGKLSDESQVGSRRQRRKDSRESSGKDRPSREGPGEVVERRIMRRPPLEPAATVALDTNTIPL